MVLETFQRHVAYHVGFAALLKISRAPRLSGGDAVGTASVHFSIADFWQFRGRAVQIPRALCRWLESQENVRENM